jgi:pyrimidine operon attenuation protein/uracil phosphoribosyltransferase
MKLNLSVDDVLTTTRTVRKRLDLSKPVPRAVIEE